MVIAQGVSNRYLVLVLVLGSYTNLSASTLGVCFNVDIARDVWWSLEYMVISEAHETLTRLVQSGFLGAALAQSG